MPNVIVGPVLTENCHFYFSLSELMGPGDPPRGVVSHTNRPHSLVSTQTNYNKKPHIHLILLFEENNVRPFMLLNYAVYAS